MRTIGVDLASHPKKTGLCIIDWQVGAATVEFLDINQTNGDIVTAAAKTGFPVDAAIGIDAPFGWPRPFLAFLDATQYGGINLATLPSSNALWWYWTTDAYVKAAAHKVPLFVAMDKIASVAVRCQYLQAGLGCPDRAGADNVFEVYPIASLMRWGAPLPTPAINTGPTLAFIAAQIPALLITPANMALMKANSDAFDAFIAALTTRAAACGLVDAIPANDLPAAQQEGWIQLPEATALAKLVAGK